VPIPDKWPHHWGTNSSGKRDTTIGMDWKKEYFPGRTETAGPN